MASPPNQLGEIRNPPLEYRSLTMQSTFPLLQKLLKGGMQSPMAPNLTSYSNPGERVHTKQTLSEDYTLTQMLIIGMRWKRMMITS